ncbi:MAG: serine/threonine protein kinase [Planctomycetes bacterium]|nr:serine/threonine protein kinase [Planctomycetota bacterium]
MSLPLAANTVDAAALADELARFRIVDPVRLNELLAEFTGGGPAALAEHLVRRGVLTPFQAGRALAGEARVLVLGPYRLVGTPGRGTFGPLFLATHTSKPGRFAVRVLPLRSLWKAKQAKQLARTIAAKVVHPTVVPLVEVDSANGFHYLVWAHAEGERLADRVAAAGPLPAGEAATLLGHLAGALAACHARGAPHGALTPYSVAIGPDGLPRLLELGAGALLAENVADDESLFDSMSAAFASACVLTFAAPELAAEPHRLTEAADQYALGALGYFAVTGLAPYPHPTLVEELRAKRAGPPPSAAVVNPAVPAELAAVLERMMAPNPADRFPAFAEVEARCAELAAADPVVAAEPPVESLMLSRLRDARRESGAISWESTGSGLVRPPERDDTDASVTFELPDALPGGAAESVVAAPGPIPSFPSAFVDESGLASETPTEYSRPIHTDYRPPAPPPDQPDSVEAPVPAPLPPAPASSDPRLSAPTPVRWHPTEAPEAPGNEPEARADGAAPAGSALWKKMKRNLLFWQTARDPVQVSVFGPPAVVPGQTVKVTIYLHTPDAAANVRTLSRAFQHDAELIGTGRLAREVARASELAVHLSVANAGVAKTQHEFEWRGQPHRLVFDLHVPWESPEGTSPGLVSVGLDNVRVGKIEFRLYVLPRKA